jgi:transposase
LSFAELGGRNLKNSRAWCRKSTFDEFWTQSTARRAATFVRQWFGAARCSEIEPIKRTALILENHPSGLLNCFAHPITEAIAEGFSSKGQAIAADVRGFRRFDSTRYRILRPCGRLDFRPAIS